MWSKDTSSPHTEHTRWYLMRPPSLSCSWLKRRVFSSVAGKTLIGIETRPNEMAPLHMVLGIGSPSGEVSPAQPARRPTILLVGWPAAGSPGRPRRVVGTAITIRGMPPRRKQAGPAFTVKFPTAL